MKEINPSPCYFLELSIENVRCFGPKQTIDFRRADANHARWTVILGDNGVGKTTLLQCLWLMSPVAYEPEPGVLYGTIPRSTHRMAWPSDNARTMVDVLARDRVGFELESAVVFQTPGGDGVLKLSERRTTTGVQGSQFGDLELTMVCVAYGASRKPSDGRVTATAAWDAATLFEEGTFLINAEEWYRNSDHAAKSDSSGRMARQHQQVEVILCRLLGVDELRLSGLDQRVPKPMLEAKTSAGWVPVSSFSLGYRTTIAWIVDFAVRLFERYPDSDDPLAEPAVCLVDEIDLHLHPRWQRELIDFLSTTFPRTQFIVTAHSPLVVQATQDVEAKLVVLRYDDAAGHVVIDDEVEDVWGWRVDQILTSELFGIKGPRSPAANDLYERRARLVIET